MATHSTSPQEIRHRVNHFLTKLSDRDTESLAAAELSAIARNLTADSLPPFISALSDARPTDKTPLRRHSLRLLSLLARSLPSSSLSPHLHRLLAAALRRLRDPDSSVRAALVDTVRSLAAVTPPAGLVSTLLRPLADALFHEQDIHPQSVSALSLSAVLEKCNSEETEELAVFLERLVPRLVKLARSPAFKAKPAVLELVGSVSLAASGIGDAELKLLITCLLEFLGSQSWAARNAAAMALTRLAVAKKDRLCEYKQSCVARFEARRFDKVKIVRDSMNRMLDVWREIPEKELDLLPPSESQSNSYVKEIGCDRRYQPASILSSSSVQSSSPLTSRKMRIPTCKSPPNAATPIVTAKKIEFDQKRNLRKINQKRNSDPLYKVENENILTKTEEVLNSCQQERSENNGRSRLEVKRALFEKNWDDKKIGGLKSGSRIVPFEEIGSSELTNEAAVTSDKIHGEQKDGDLSMIRMHLVQIENQQSSLLNLLQRFIGSSQKGIHSLEARVLNLEMALENMSRDLASSSSGRVMNTDPAAKLCCRFPGTEFLSSKFWRRAERRYASRFLTYKQERQKFGFSGGFVNPLAEG
ncbi:TORTIFOLIA1-like protein 4 [Phalaenopsis equestris]|uniref:TORTIFOLIA1-like protein 4 n=1 Tax=Phalaenopsis equestris TaxID=78828 RepID=UPI0009E2F647|nr:TORTIFOLIA1-like protein 4 [Phalaenopsis equestris]